jgi:hypothetical protein
MSDELTTRDDGGDRDMDNTPAPGDAQLWRELAAMWQEHDPVPEGLVEHVLVALATEDLDAEYELLHLVSRTTELAGARGNGDALTISFSGESFALLLRVSGINGDDRRVDGWVTPAREMRVTVKQKNRSWAAEVDAHGRFELSNLPAGLSRFWLVGTPSGDGDEEQALFATPTFEL